MGTINTSVMQRMIQSEKETIALRVWEMRTYIGRYFHFNGVDYLIEDYNEKDNQFVFNGVDELTAKTVLSRLISES